MTEVEARAVLQRFGAFADQFAPCFGRHVQRGAASRYLAGLVNDSARKSMQAMHGRLSDAGSYQALQHFITHSPWAVGPVWARLRAAIADRSGTLAVDDTGFPKQGTHSVGVKRQYCGALGKTGNCQVGVSTALIGPTLVWPTSCELYLPTEWTGNPDRRDTARVPTTVRFREEWRIGLAHIREVLKAGFAVEAVVADADHGTTTGFRAGRRARRPSRGGASFQAVRTAGNHSAQTALPSPAFAPEGRLVRQASTDDERRWTGSRLTERALSSAGVPR